MIADESLFQGSIEDAEAHILELSRMLAEGGPDADLHQRLYTANRSLGRLDEAYVHASARAEALPELARPLERMAELAATTGDLAAEIDAVSRLLRVGGENLTLRNRLVRRLARAGRQHEAGPHLQVLAEAAKQDEESRRRWSPLLSKSEGRAVETPAGAGVCLIFFHAHKTGGASMLESLQQLFGDRYLRATAFNAPDLVQAMSAPQRSRLCALAGHFDYDQAEDSGLAAMFRKPVFYLGLVRDPVARAKSIYVFFRNTRGDSLERQRYLRVRDDDDINVVVERWLDSPGDWAGWRHDQCRRLCGEPSAEVARRTIMDRYLAVVTTPRVNDLVAALADGLSIAAPPTVRAKRSFSEQVQIDPVLEARLRSHQSEDQRLYEWVEENQGRMLEQARDRLRDLAPA